MNVARADGTALVDHEALKQAAGVPLVYSGNGRYTIKGAQGLYGLTVEATVSARLALDAADQTVSLADVKVDVAGYALPDVVAQQLVKVVVRPIPLEGIPFELRVTSVDAEDDGPARRPRGPGHPRPPLSRSGRGARPARSALAAGFVGQARVQAALVDRDGAVLRPDRARRAVRLPAGRGEEALQRAGPRASTHQRAWLKPSARRVSAHAFSSRDPWPRRCAGGSTQNSSTSPSTPASASTSVEGPVVAKPTTRPSPATATRTRWRASAGRATTRSQACTMAASSTAASSGSASGAGRPEPAAPLHGGDRGRLRGPGQPDGVGHRGGLGHRAMLSTRPCDRGHVRLAVTSGGPWRCPS